MADEAPVVAPVTELPTRFAPALSATSDAPVVAAPAEPEPKPEVPAEAPKPEGEETPAAPAEGEEAPAAEAGAEDDPLTSDKTPAWMKAAITKQRNKTRAAEDAQKTAETRADTAAANLQKALDAVEKLTGLSAEKAAAAEEAKDPRPAREGFEDPNAYDEALIEWAGRAAARTALAEAETERQGKAKADADEKAKIEQAARNQEALDAFAARREAFEATHPDYTEIAQAHDVEISVAMARVIMEDEDGPAMAYYLGQNKDEAERISKLSFAKAASELGRIAAKLNAPRPVIKKAPIKPLSANGSPAETSSTKEESMEEYGARRLAQLRGKANGHSPPH